MSFTRQWSAGTPTNATNANTIDDEFRNMKEDIIERLSEEHDFASDEAGNTTIGEHKKGSARIGFGLTGSKPEVNSTNTGGFYVTEDAEGNPTNAEYDNGTTWKSIATIPRADITALEALAASFVGVVCPFAASSVPTGWLECDGALVSRETYATLFGIIGVTWGVGDGSTTFALPDFRGEFLRGWDHSRDVDTGRAFASAQTDALKSHTHSYTSPASGPVGTQFVSTMMSSSSSNTTGATGITETRPRNIAVMFCIKY